MPRDQDDKRAEIADGLCVGDVLADKYRVDRVLGEGGMGVVVAAWHTRLDEQVAIKFLLREALDNKEALARFSREARAAFKIKSEHVARVIDVGNLESGAPYMVMEYLHGEDLAQRLKSRGPLPVDQAVEFVLQACEAVAEAHGLSIIHRDLKPSNLFVVQHADGSPSVKVLDFGISKAGALAATGEFDMTRTQRMMGSPFYMSPEQMASSRSVDTRTDQWALAVTLYELLTGKPPFTADSLPQLCVNIAQEPPPSLREQRPEVPEGLQEVIERCLQKDRNDRYPSLADFAMALVPFGTERSQISAERVARVLKVAGMTSVDTESPATGTVETVSTPPSGARTQATWQTTKPGTRRRKLSALVLGSVGGLLVVGLVIVGLWSSTGESVELSPAADTSAAGSASPQSVDAAETQLGSLEVTPVVPGDAVPGVSAGTAGATPSASTGKVAPRATSAGALPTSGAKTVSARPSAPAAAKQPSKSTVASPQNTAAKPTDLYGHRR